MKKLQWTISQSMSGNFILLMFYEDVSVYRARRIRRYPFETFENAARRTKYRMICSYRRERKEQRTLNRLMEEMEKCL